MTLPELYVNNNKFNFGKTQRHQIIVNDFILPNWSKDDPRKFTLILRKVLESTKVNKKLNLWIDLVFGYKQTGVEAEKNFNKFRSWCYYLDEEEKNEMIQQNEISNYMLIKQEFGYVPKQLFKKAHKEKKSFEEFKEYENIFLMIMQNY